MKLCPKCNTKKPLDEFGKNKSRKDGHQGHCKECLKAVFNQNKDKYNKARRDKARKDPRASMLTRAKQRAIKEGYPCTIEVEDIVVPKYCPVLGTELKVAKGFNDDNSPSLDKYDPSLGYVPGNITVISYRANRFKSDATTEELEKLLKWRKEYENEQNKTT